MAFRPASAIAQSMLESLPPLLRGAAYPVVQPENVMVLLALGLAAGSSGWQQGWRWMLPAFAAGAAVACILLSHTIMPPAFWLLSLVFALWLGLIAALALPLPPPVLIVFAAAVGFAVGLDIVPVGRVRIADLTMRGALAIGLMAVVWMCVTAAIAHMTTAWLRIGIRIAGSWIAAIAGLLLALRFAI